jgi:hypothetical protein
MKRNTWFFMVVVLLLGVSTGLTHAQGGILAIHAGYTNPKDTQSGMLIGASFGTAIDEAVNIGIGLDVFHKTYTEESKVAEVDEEGLTTKTYVTSVEYARTMLPLMLVLNAKIPASRYAGYFVRGALGYEFLISKEKNYEQNSSKTRNFGGLGWQLAGGLYYNIGRRSTLVADVFYNNADVSRSVQKSDKGLPVSERVDLSGLGFRLGVQLEMR